MALRIPISEKDHISGSPSAHIELLQYGDYQCPYCWKAYPIVKALQQQLGAQLRFIFRNFPLTKVHPNAMIAAMASEAADQQGRYWEMHDTLYEHHKNLDYASLLEYAGTLGLDMARFEQDMQNKTLEEKIESEFYNGLRSGVNATPTFFINGEKYTGPWDNNNLVEYIWMSGLYHSKDK